MESSAEGIQTVAGHGDCTDASSGRHSRHHSCSSWWRPSHPYGGPGSDSGPSCNRGPSGNDRGAAEPHLEHPGLCPTRHPRDVCSRCALRGSAHRGLPHKHQPNRRACRHGGVQRDGLLTFDARLPPGLVLPSRLWLQHNELTKWYQVGSSCAQQLSHVAVAAGV